MKILFISTVFMPAIGFGGPVTNTLELAKHITRKNHDIIVFSSNAYDFKENIDIEKKEISENLNVFYFKNWCRRLESFITPGMIIGLIKERKNYDIIHIHTYRQFQDVICYLLLFFLNKPFVMTIHGMIIPKGRGKKIKKFFDLVIGKSILKKSEFIISNSSLQTKEFSKMNIDKEKILEIPFGVKKFFKKHGYLKNKLNILEDAGIILYIGRIHADKGLNTLVQAFQKIENEKCHLVIAGPDYGFKVELEKIISKLSSKPRIHLIGTINEEQRDQILSESLMLVQPSEYESFGMIALEAAVAGLPIIISDSCGLADEFFVHKAGIIFKTNDTNELTNKIDQIVNDENLQKELGEKAKEFANKFDWEIIANQHLEMYNNVLKKQE